MNVEHQRSREPFAKLKLAFFFVRTKDEMHTEAGSQKFFQWWLCNVLDNTRINDNYIFPQSSLFSF